MDKKIALRDVLLQEIYTLMKKDKNIFFLTADFGSPVIDKIKNDYPERFLNVGIAEQNLINIACGLGLEGFKVVCYAIAPFITMRCYEQIRVNLALLSTVRKINVNLIGVGAGYSYSISGPTHQCFEDLSIINTLPGINIFSPSDESTTRGIPKYLLNNNGITYTRLDAQPICNLLVNSNYNNRDGYRILNTYNEHIIFSTGYMTHITKKVVENLETKHQLKVGFIDFINLRNFNKKKLLDHIKRTKKIFTIEEGFINKAGFDSIITELLNNGNLNIVTKNIGIKNKYTFNIGTRDEIHKKLRIDANSICKYIKGLIWNTR